MALTLGTIKTNSIGFQRIIELNSQITKGCEIDISNLIDANIYAPHGVIIYSK